eukprot:1966561-Amphidinium_carterae.1
MASRKCDHPSRSNTSMRKALALGKQIRSTKERHSVTPAFLTVFDHRATEHVYPKPSRGKEAEPECEYLDLVA